MIKIVFLKLFHCYITGVVVLIGLVGTFIHHNSSLKRQVILRVSTVEMQSFLVMYLEALCSHTGKNVFRQLPDFRHSHQDFPCIK